MGTIIISFTGKLSQAQEKEAARVLKEIDPTLQLPTNPEGAIEVSFDTTEPVGVTNANRK